MKTPCSLLLLLCCPLVLFCQTDRLRDSLLRRAQTADADTTRVWALMETGKLFLNTNADSALLYLRPALQLAEQTGFEKGMARCRINSAVAWFDLGQFDSVQTLCNGAIPLCERLGLRKELVAVYNLLGNTWSARENGWLAIRAFEKCLEVMKTAEVPPHYPIVVNDNISNLYLRLDLYAKGLEYARECARLAEANGDELTMCTAFIHIGNAYKGLEKPELALPVYEKSIQLARKNNYNRVLATALSAAAEIHANTGKESLAIDMYQEGLRVAQAGGDREGQMYNLHGLSLIELTQGQWAAAQRHADDALQLADTMQYDAYRYAIHLTLSDIALVRGHLSDYQWHREKYRDIRNQAAQKARVYALQELETKYETEKKEQHIRQLEQEQEIAQLRLRQKNGWIAGSTGAAILLLLLSALAWRNYQTRKKLLHNEILLQQQQVKDLETGRQLAVATAVLKGQEDERSRLAKDLHDGLGGRLSGIRQTLNQLQYQLPPEQSELPARLLDNLDQSISELRFIARNMMPEALVRFGLSEALEDICAHLHQPAGLQVQFQSFGFAERLPPDSEVVLFRIAQELLNNVVRHAQASQVLVQLLRDGARISLTVEDNGKGFDPAELERQQGIGWMNIRSRAQMLDALLDIRSAPGKGCSVHLQFELP